MDELRSSHRLLRRLALLALIHGVSAAACSEQLDAAERSSAPRRSQTAPQLGSIQKNPFTEKASASSAKENSFAQAASPVVNVTSTATPVAVTSTLTSPNVPTAKSSPTGTDTMLVRGLRKNPKSEPDLLHVPMRLPDPSEEKNIAPVRLPEPPIQTEPPIQIAAVDRHHAPESIERKSFEYVPMRLPVAVTAKPVATRLPPTEPHTALAAMSQSTPPWIEPHLELPAPSAAPIEATMNASKLRAMARESLRDANSRLKRDATHSAHKIASEALELLVAIGDARDGGTTHTRQLESAMSAIRESKDFWSARGPVDQETLVRSTAVHETKVLQARSLNEVSPLHATSEYLAYAKEQFALAAQPVPEASDAFLLLAQIERKLANSTDPHAAAVVLTMHRAAVAVDPSNGYCRRELGKALLHQGLDDEALSELELANNTYPTRDGFQALREAALRVGDEALARRCIAAMNDSRLPPDTPVYRLAPEQFAATHSPSPTDLTRPINATGKLNSSGPSSQVTDKKSWFPFGRR